MLDLVELVGKTARLHPHPGQKAVWDSKNRFVFMIAGTQGGKTAWGPWWLLREIQRCGPGDYLAVTATYDLFKLKMLPALKEVFVDWTGWGEYRAGDRVIQSRDGESRIILRSANAPDGLESATAKAAWLDECGQDAFRIDAWEAVLRRLSLYQGRVFGSSTPYNWGWLKTEVHDRWRSGDADFFIEQFASTLNPAFPQEEYDRAQRTLPSWKFNMFYRGIFERPEGLIFSRWDEEQALVDPFEIPTDWVRYVGVDFGGVNTAMVWAALNPESKDLYLYDESLMGDKTVAEHAAIALMKKREQGNPTTYAYGGAGSEEQWRRDFSASGFVIRRPPIGGVEEGLDRVIGLMSKNRLKMLRGKCPQLREQINIYSRELDRDGNVTEKIANKEMQHFCDSLRYLCVGFGRQGTFFM